MSHRVRARLPWALFGLSSALTLLSLVLLAVNRSQPNVHVFDFWVDVTVLAAVCPVTGAVIASRRPENRIGWIFCAIGFLAALDHFSAEYAIFALLGSGPAWPGGAAMAWIRGWIWVIYHGLFVFLALLFPTGRLPSRRWRFLASLTVIVVVLGALAVALAPGPVDGLGPIQNPLGAAPLGAIGATTMVGVVETMLSGLALGGAASLMLRVRFARGEERLQLKWFAYAAVVAASGGALTYIIPDTIATAWMQWASWIVLQIGLVGLPLSVSIAILHYRLYDIDVIINRTLVYGALSMTLLATFFGSVFALETMLRPIVRINSGLATMVSTLAITAVFQPFRQRIQNAIDRRFYRRKYDAAATLQAFSARLRDEVDLNRLSDDLVSTIQETMQPAHCSLWLRNVPAAPPADG